MSDPSRPISRWSTSLSVTTKSTGSTNQTIPLVNVRKKLFRSSAYTQKSAAQRTAKSKHDIEELFKIYYSNNVRFDTFQRQIVTGTRIPTARQSVSTQNTLTNSSANAFTSKHCVSRELLSRTDIDCTERQPINNEIITKFPSKKRSVQIQVENKPVIPFQLPSSRFHLPPPTKIPTILNLPVSSSSIQQDELCDSSLVKSIPFLEDMSSESYENMDTKINKSNNIQCSKSSFLTMPPPPPPSSLLLMNNSQKDSMIQSHTTFSTLNSVEQPQNHPTVVTGSAVTVRQRSPIKQSWNKQRAKSNMTVTTNSSLPQSTSKTRSSLITSPLSIQPDTPEVPVFVGSQRVVSIPSRCSRYVLVTFPEAPLRYNTPTYVERLLLPERFPTLFHNIIQSYDHHLTRIPHNRNTK